MSEMGESEGEAEEAGEEGAKVTTFVKHAKRVRVMHANPLW